MPGGASENDRVFETIDDDDLGIFVEFRRLSDEEASAVMSEPEFLSRLGAAGEVSMREGPKLVSIVGDPPFAAEGADGPLWAFLPNIPPFGSGPIPEGVETFVLQLYNARTGELVLEFGGPIRDGHNEWHPDFPEELRYGIEDQIR